MRHNLIFRTTIGLMAVLMLAACGDVAGDPAPIVEQYLEAKIAGDADGIGALLCADMESQLAAEAGSFAAVSSARIEGMSCTTTSNENGAATVACEGTIIANYGQEDTEFPLASYDLVQEDGEWRWCGVSR